MDDADARRKLLAHLGAGRESPTRPLTPGFDVRHTVAMNRPLVVVVEDDTFSRTLIVSTLTSQGCDVVAATASASTGLSIVRGKKVDVALLDLDLGPGPTGFDVAMVVRRENPRIGIVFLTSYRDPRLLGGAHYDLPVGSRFLQKSELVDSATLMNTVRHAHLAPLEPQPGLPKPAELTDHQLTVLKLVAQGLTTKEIAQKTGVSSKAVEASITRVRRILGLGDPGQASSRVSLVQAFYAMTGRNPPRG